MARSSMQLGDWVKALETIEDGEGTVFALKGDVGHVVDVLDDEDGWVCVLFERSGRVTGALPDQICQADMPIFFRSAVKKEEKGVLYAS